MMPQFMLTKNLKSFMMNYRHISRHAHLKVSHKTLSFEAKPWISMRIQNMMLKRDRYLGRFNASGSRDMEYL